MPLVINTRSYTADTQVNNSWMYRDPASTAGLPSTLRIARTAPVATPSFPGQAKGEAKFTKMFMVNLKPLPALIRAESSIPVGLTAAEQDVLIADFRSFVASSAFVDLVKEGKIYHA